MATVEVLLGERSYGIHIGQGFLDNVGTLAAERLKGRRGIVLSSAPIAERHGARVQESLKRAGFDAGTFLLADGELSKSLPEVGRALSEMARRRLDRSSVVFALGGGAIGDSAGLAASLFMRGVSLVQIPTTLLAMVDSSVGGKTGVNLAEGKNLVGTFHQPSLVVIDPTVLSSLHLRHLQASVAEIIKYGVICDRDLFNRMALGVPADWSPIIQRCCEIKAGIVERDEFERLDVRAILNYGHTIGHAIEAAAEFGGLLHGEAVAIGMVGASYLSVKRAGLAPVAAKEISDLLSLYRLPVSWSALDPESVMAWMMRDKKFASGKMRFVLLRDIGHACVSSDVTLDDVHEALEVCRGL
jgi:3-dehydroquinate synthase